MGPLLHERMLEQVFFLQNKFLNNLKTSFVIKSQMQILAQI